MNNTSTGLLVATGDKNKPEKPATPLEKKGLTPPPKPEPPPKKK